MELQYNKEEFNSFQFNDSLPENIKSKISGYKYVQSNLTVYLSAVLTEQEKQDLDQAIIDHVPVEEFPLRIYRAVSKNYTHDYIMNEVDFSILGFRKMSPYYDRGRKRSAEYWCADKDEIIVRKTFSDVLDENGKLIELKVLFEWFKENGEVGLSKTQIVERYSKSKARTVLRERRYRAMDFLESEAEGTPLEPIMEYLTTLFHNEIEKWKSHNSDVFKEALFNTTDPTAQAYLNIQVPLTSMPHLQTKIINSILFQINELTEQEFMATVTPVEN